MQRRNSEKKGFVALCKEDTVRGKVSLRYVKKTQ